jgi:hypothetical protein
MESITYPLLTDYTQPILRQGTANNTEADLAAIFASVFSSLLSPRLIDIRDYGTPAIGSRNVLERLIKQQGLAVLIRDTTDTDYNTTTAIMRAIYESYLALGSDRGLNFLQFVLQMLFPNIWSIKRVWHLSSAAAEYPRYLTTEPYGSPDYTDFFLTSRIQITLNDTVQPTVLAEIAPVLRRLVPANIYPKVAILIQVDDLGIGYAMGMIGTMVQDLSPFY